MAAYFHSYTRVLRPLAQEEKAQLDKQCGIISNVTCQRALVHRAEGVEPSLEGGLGRAPPAKKETPEVCTNWSFYGPFLHFIIHLSQATV